MPPNSTHERPGEVPEIDLCGVYVAPMSLVIVAAWLVSSAKAGDLVAVLGVGGLGHLAVQYTRHMDLRSRRSGAEP
jgi:D-arabinose 1-dehydrogenase-like Zn-dependent alcohol dehydrogenase